MEAIILAGGLGTRLTPIIQDVPKPMAPVCGKPFLFYLVKKLIESGIERIIFSVGYKHEFISDYFHNSFMGAKIDYSIEDKSLGTGGAINKSINYVNMEDIFVLNGDSFFDVDLSSMRNFQDVNDADIVVSLKRMRNADRYGRVIVDDNGKILKFCEKDFFKEGFINGGVYLMNKNIFRKADIDKEVFSFEKDILSQCNQKLSIWGLIFDGFFIDIGTPEDYLKAQHFFRKDYFPEQNI